MTELMTILAWIGIFSPLALGTTGSVYGCAIAGQTAIGAMLDVESGYGKYIGIAVLPSTHSILGIVTMFALNRPITPQNAGGSFCYWFFDRHFLAFMWY